MKTKLAILAAAIAAMPLLPTAAAAQKTPGANVVTVDLQRIYAECTACKAANTALQGQVTGIQQRQQQLGQSLQTEATGIRTALGGKDPGAADAATKKRIEAFQQKQGAAQQELQGKEQSIQRNRAYVLQQINAKLGPIYQSVMSARGANLMVDTAATLAVGASLDATNDVLAQLNQQLPSVNTTAPATPAPQGR